MQTAEDRLAKVEGQLRRQQGIGVVLLLALAMVVGYGATGGVPDVLRARKIVLVSDSGRDLLVMDQVQGKAALTIYGGEGDATPRLKFHEQYDGQGRLEIYNRGGQLVLVAGAGGYPGAKGHGVLDLHNEAGLPHIILRANSGPRSGIQVQEPKPPGVATLVQIHSDPSGKKGVVEVFDSSGSNQKLEPR